MKTLVLIFALLSCARIACANNAVDEIHWQTQEHIQNIELATAIDDSGASWVKVSTVVDAQFWSLLNLLRDTQIATEWVDNAEQITLFQRPDYRTDLVYTVIHAPWPFANREMCTLSTVTFQIAQQTMNIAVQQINSCQRNEKNVVMENVKGSWYAEQISPNKTRITWYGTGVAGGSIPDWLAVSQLQSSTFKTFKKLRNKITTTKYQDKPLAYQIYAEKVDSAPE